MRSHRIHNIANVLGTIVLWCAATLSSHTTAATSVDASEAANDRIAWWREARFGLFIHWGPVSLKGTEIGWSRGGERRGYNSKGNQIPVDVYDNLYKQFNPTNFNAREWVQIAQAAGMKYLVFTSRHHDGFNMFDTKANDYKITNPLSPFRRDVVKELADACHEAGFKFGIYYSQPDWRHPDAFTPDRHAQYLDYLKLQVRELLTGYGRLDVFWFDGLGKSANDYDATTLNRTIRELQPHILINNRNGLPEDFDTPEQHVGNYQDHRPWESCITICQQWAWKPHDRMKGLQECLQTLLRCAGGDGNLLFNVGPMPDGRIEPRQVARLQEIGRWLKEYGHTIYGTRGGPYKPGPWGASTRLGNKVFLHVFSWKPEGITLPPLARQVTAGRVLSGGNVSVEQSTDQLRLQVSANDRKPISTVIEITLEGSAMDIAPIEVSTLPKGWKARASNVFQGNSHYAASQAFDGDLDSRWATDNGTHQAWLELELPKSRRFTHAVIDEWYQGASRVKTFQIQYWDGDWKTAAEGGTIGNKREIALKPFTAARVRLNILEATEGPTIKEFLLE